MKIEKNKVVSVSYVLETDNLEGKRVHVETADEQHPLVFIYGTGGMIPKFETELSGMAANDRFSFTISPDEAYGLIDEAAVVDLPHSVFEIEGNLDLEQFPVGTWIPMRDQNGHPLEGQVVGHNADSIRVDFNHPMAGQTLHFSGCILEVREADAEELAHGHVHGPGGHHHD